MKKEKYRIRTIIVAAGLIGLFAISTIAQSKASNEKKSNEENRAARSTTVFSKIMNAPDKRIPVSILKKTDCIAVFPGVLNAAFIVGGRYGKGLISCRTKDGWSSPAFLKMKGGSLGWQIGGQSTDYVLLFMTENSIKSLLSSKFTIGTEASVAAGPVGRSASVSTDAKAKAQILSYSRTKGIFAGLALNGVSIRPDKEANKNALGKDAAPEQVLKESPKSGLAVNVFPESLGDQIKASEAKKDGRK